MILIRELKLDMTSLNLNLKEEKCLWLIEMCIVITVMIKLIGFFRLC